MVVFIAMATVLMITKRIVEQDKNKYLKKTKTLKENSIDDNKSTAVPLFQNCVKFSNRIIILDNKITIQILNKW